MSEQQFNKVCKDLFEKIFDKLDNIDKRLFHDNGSESLQSRINRFGQWIENNETYSAKKASFWYWLIPVIVGVGIVIIDKLWK